MMVCTKYRARIRRPSIFGGQKRRESDPAIVGLGWKLQLLHKQTYFLLSSWTLRINTRGPKDSTFTYRDSVASHGVTNRTDNETLPC